MGRMIGKPENASGRGGKRHGRLGGGVSMTPVGDGTLRLLRTEVAGPDSVSLVFEGSYGEESWLLENTSLSEFFALLLHGRIRPGGQLVVDGTVMLEPPQRAGDKPALCISTGVVEGYVPVDRSTLRALQAEISRMLGPSD